jgi:hypothetical protein
MYSHKDYFGQIIIFSRVEIDINLVLEMENGLNPKILQKGFVHQAIN